MTPQIIALEKTHEVRRFNCGNDVLNRWLQQTARQHQKNSISQTFVLVKEDEPGTILGFYALSLRSMTPNEELPADVAKKLPWHVPGITLARLAVQEDEQGNRYGEELLVDAMTRSRNASKGVGGWALFIDAKDEKAAAFYLKYGFTPLPSNPLMLFMPFADMPE
ncbi:GNAT family N-acetyltransferase [Herbaspirillum autotrophicum]|uniref:GNAT family N-acetyltransferase n=1 Tax=Herbaspirillum autotrophicum TaxID=180195 RepID=UPI0009FA594E|nr:GNAT family N-acetyltransferase [Herbaspirillum autotrophicum]